MSPQRVILVTGAGRGIGLATVRLLAERGHRVFAGVRRTDALSDGLTELVERLPDAVDTDIRGTGLAQAEQIPQAASGLYGHLIERATAGARGANERGISPDVVAGTILDVLTARRPPARRTVGRDARIGRLVGKLPAALVDGMLAR